MSEQETYRPTTCRICHKVLEKKTNGRPRKTCGDRCRQIKRRQNDRKWRTPRDQAKLRNKGKRDLKRIEKQRGPIDDTLPERREIGDPSLSVRARILIRLERGIVVPQCHICKQYYLEYQPGADMEVCSSKCRMVLTERQEAVQRGLLKWAGQYDPRVDVRLQMGASVKACERCEKPFCDYYPVQRFCCGNCRKAAWRALRRKCARCKKLFLPEKFRPDQKYCSERCNHMAYEQRKREKKPVPADRICPGCGKKFEYAPNKIYCTSRCGKHTNYLNRMQQQRDKELM